MKNWYLTREAGTLIHCGQGIELGKKIFLTESQAAIHGEKIEPCDPPLDLTEAGVESEWDDALYKVESAEVERRESSQVVREE